MADYYPLLAKALANLPNRSTPTARRAIYERARKALIGQLRSIQPPMAEADIAGEDSALDQAIARLEAEYGAQTAPASAPATAPSPSPGPAANPRPAPTAAPTPAPAAASPRPIPATPPLAPAIPRPTSASSAFATTRPSPPPARPAPAPALTPKPPGASGAALAPAAPASSPLRAPIAPPTPRPPTLGAPLPGAPANPRAAPSIEPARPLASEATSASIAPPVAAHQASGANESDIAPPIAAAPPTLGIPPRAGATIARPSAPGRAEARRRNPWPLVALVLLICAAGAIAATAYLLRDKPLDAANKTTTDTADKTKQASQNKIAERITGAGQSDPAPAAGETPIPTVTVPVAPVQVAPSTAAAAPTHLTDNASGAPAAGQSQAPNQAQTPTQAQPPAAPPAPPGSSRAAMLIGVASDPQKPIVQLGNALWSIIPPSSGQPASLAVRVEIDIPDQRLHATVTIRKNTDASLPATHTIDLRATFADGSEIKGVKDMGLPQLRKDDAPTGDAVSGVRVKINDSYYLVGLTRSDTDAAHNLDLLATRSWFDFPLLLNDDRIAKLTFTKGEAGDRVMAQALDAWK